MDPLIADTGGIYALYDASDDFHAKAKQQFEKEQPRSIYVSTAILVEIEYLFSKFLSIDAFYDFIAAIEGRFFTLVNYNLEDLKRSQEIMKQYQDFHLGLADAAVMATAESLNSKRVFAVDQRHFRQILFKNIKPYNLVLFDE